MVLRVGEGMEQALANETNPEVFLDVKESLIAFSATLEVSHGRELRSEIFISHKIKGYSYSTQQLHSLLMVLFEKYEALLEHQYNKRFDNVSCL